MYTLIFDKQFKRDIDRLDKSIKDQILKKILQLEVNPEIGKHLIGIDLWSLRVGKYRILDRINKLRLLVLVLMVEHRKKVYDKI